MEFNLTVFIFSFKDEHKSEQDFKNITFTDAVLVGRAQYYSVVS